MFVPKVNMATEKDSHSPPVLFKIENDYACVLQERIPEDSYLSKLVKYPEITEKDENGAIIINNDQFQVSMYDFNIIKDWLKDRTLGNVPPFLAVVRRIKSVAKYFALEEMCKQLKDKERKCIGDKMIKLLISSHEFTLIFDKRSTSYDYLVIFAKNSAQLGHTYAKQEDDNTIKVLRFSDSPFNDYTILWLPERKQIYFMEPFKKISTIQIS
eukprot:gb/GECH01008526.1/.p1 GENE.gb/GECH01008526.1/~~gb/GECH01008526.1/.p1  ORF type:complete len:213 (+),score=34.98 gb/GECH01008526.1/:1-639(+)